jgi:ribose transport system ATP-binding protein
MVAIARALQDQESDSAVLVLDEPTAALPAHESELLLAAIRRRAERGQTILMVSHRMQEVLDTADDFTVFRDGCTVGTLVSAEPTEHQLVTLMTGRESLLSDDKNEKSGTTGTAGKSATGATGATGAEPSAADAGTAAALRVEGLVAGPLRGVSITVQPGEIVGVTGLVGSGRSSLLRTVFGVHPPQGGAVWIGGRRQRGSEDVRARMAQGVAYVAEDRVAESSFASLSVRENLSASVLARFWRPWGMATAEERGTAAGLVRQHKVKAPSVESPFSALSGGNQQKAILARWLRRDPRLLLLDEPTQGVDVMSRADIYRTIRQSAENGCGVVVASSDFVELSALCDRVVVLAGGRVATELRGARLTPDHLTAATQSSVLSTGAQP